jgi:hypothetical protein
MLGGLGVAGFVACSTAAFFIFEAVALRFVAPKWAALIAAVLSGVTVYGSFGFVLGLARIISMPREGAHTPTKRFWYASAALTAAGLVAGTVGWRMEEARKARVAECKADFDKADLAPFYVVGCEHDGARRLAQAQLVDAHGVRFAVKQEFGGNERKYMSARELSNAFGWTLMTDAEYKEWEDDFEFIATDPSP